MDPSLFRALVRGDSDELQRLIELQREPEAEGRVLQGVTPEGDTVLHVAARFGHHDLLRVVYLDNGDNLEAWWRNNATVSCNHRGDSALHCAASSTVRMVQALFSIASSPWRCADLLRWRKHAGETCLHEAVRCWRVEVVKLLVEKDEALQFRGCPLAQIVDSEGISPLYLAATLDRVRSPIWHEIIRILTDTARRSRASYTGPRGRTALHAAVLVNCSDICKELLRWDAEGDGDLLRRADESRSTPLHYLASSRCSVGIAKLFLERRDGEESDASIAYCADSTGSLPIHVAAGHGRVNILKLLLKECPDCVWSRNSSGKTFLHVAVENERSNVVQYICSLQDEVRMFITTTILNAKDHDGNTALHLAVLKANHPELFCILLRRKEVDLNIANRNGHTPLDLVFLSGEVDPDLTGTEGYVVPHLAFLSGQRTFRYIQNRYDWMVYDLVIAGASRGVHRWDDMATQLPAKHNKDKEWEKVGKSAAVLAVCAVLILNATLALPFNVTTAQHNRQRPRTERSLGFRTFLALDTVAFITSAVATFCCTYAGFATAENISRRSQLYFGAGCLVAASMAIVPAFGVGLYSAFGTGLAIFPTLAVLLFLLVTLSGIIVPLRSTL